MDAKPHKPDVHPERLIAAADAILDKSRAASQRFEPYSTFEILEAYEFLRRLDLAPKPTEKTGG
jgi:hypothetical protein